MTQFLTNPTTYVGIVAVFNLFFTVVIALRKSQVDKQAKRVLLQSRMQEFYKFLNSLEDRDVAYDLIYKGHHAEVPFSRDVMLALMFYLEIVQSVFLDLGLKEEKSAHIGAKGFVEKVVARLKDVPGVKDHVAQSGYDARFKKLFMK